MFSALFYLLRMNISDKATASAATDDGNKPTNLLDLPLLAREALLSYFDTPSLLAMRLTSSATKNWIDESSKCMGRIPIYIQNKQMLNNLLTSSLSLANLVITLNGTLSGAPDNMNLCPLLTHAYSQLKHIRINVPHPPTPLPPAHENEYCGDSAIEAMRYHRRSNFFIPPREKPRHICTTDLLEIMLQLGPQVETFHFVGEIAQIRSLHRYFEPAVQARFKESLERMRSLIMEPNIRDAMDMDAMDLFLTIILRHCTKLTRLKIPFTILRKRLTWSIRPEEIACRDLFEAYLGDIQASRKDRKADQRDEIVQIEFWAGWFYYPAPGPQNNCNQFPEMKTGFENFHLASLAKLMVQSGVELVNVPVALMKNSTYVPTLQETADLNTCIASVLMRVEANVFRDYYVPPNAMVRHPGYGEPGI